MLLPAVEHGRVPRSPTCCTELPSTKREACCLLGTQTQHLEAVLKLQLWLKLLLAPRATRCSMTKPKQSGSLNYKVCIWSFHTVHNPALKVGEQRCTFKVSPKVLVLVPQGTRYWCSHNPGTGMHSFSELFLNFSSLTFTSVHISGKSSWNKGFLDQKAPE